MFCAGTLISVVEGLVFRQRARRGMIVSAAVGLGICITLGTGYVSGRLWRVSGAKLVGATLGTAWGVGPVMDWVICWLGSINRFARIGILCIHSWIQ